MPTQLWVPKNRRPWGHGPWPLAMTLAEASGGHAGPICWQFLGFLWGWGILKCWQSSHLSPTFYLLIGAYVTKNVTSAALRYTPLLRPDLMCVSWLRKPVPTPGSQASSRQFPLFGHITCILYFLSEVRSGLTSYMIIPGSTLASYLRCPFPQVHNSHRCRKLILHPWFCSIIALFLQTKYPVYLLQFSYVSKSLFRQLLFLIFLKTDLRK